MLEKSIMNYHSFHKQPLFSNPFPQYKIQHMSVVLNSCPLIFSLDLLTQHFNFILLLNLCLRQTTIGILQYFEVKSYLLPPAVPQLKLGQMGNKPNNILPPFYGMTMIYRLATGLFNRFCMIISDWIFLIGSQNWECFIGWPLCSSWGNRGPEMMDRGERPHLIPCKLVVGEEGLAERSPAPRLCCCYMASSVLTFMGVLPQINPDCMRSSFE